MITLRAARYNKGLNLADAAKRIGVNQYTLRNYERCLSFPTVPVIKKSKRYMRYLFQKLIFFANQKPFKGFDNSPLVK